MSIQKLTLCSMMKDESENCIQMLKSVEGCWDNFVVGFDSKTNDGTKGLVEEYLKDRQGVFYDFDWQDDFSLARNTYLDLALRHYPENSWCLIADGDDLFCPGHTSKVPSAREQIKHILDIPLEQFPWLAVNAYVYLDCDEFGIPMLFYPRVHMVRNLPEVRFMFASHNTITTPGEQQILIKELIVYHKQKPKKRAAREIQRVEMNIPNLEVQSESAEGVDSSRGLFYLGNTYMDSGEREKAKECYEKYLEISTWADERYQVRLHLAGIHFLAGDVATAREQARLALAEPNSWPRAESYILLADCALAEGDLMQAIHWLEFGSTLEPPVNGLFLQGHLYTWLPHWRLMLLYDRIGNIKKALTHAQLVQKWRPSAEVERAIMVLSEQTFLSQDKKFDNPNSSEIYALTEKELEESLNSLKE